jgi:hypothetical protein
MSDNEGDKEQVPEVEPEEPRTFLKQEQINDALSLIARTAGNSSIPYQSRRTFIRLQHSQSRRKRNLRAWRPPSTLRAPVQPESQQE